MLYILLLALLELGYLQVSREKPWIPSIILDNPTNLHTSGLYIESECHRRCIILFSKEWEHIVLETIFHLVFLPYYMFIYVITQRYKVA